MRRAASPINGLLRGALILALGSTVVLVPLRSARPAGANPSGGRVPATGAWFGATTGMGDDNPSNDPIVELGSHQDFVGRKFAMIRIYHAWDEVFPTDYEDWLKDQGQIPVMSWNAGELDRVHYARWADIAGGVYDSTI